MADHEASTPRPEPLESPAGHRNGWSDRSASRPQIIIPPARALAIFLLWSLLTTLPLAFRVFTHIPQGAEGVGTVPLFNLWTLQWNIEQLRKGFPDYWNAPIFAPLEQAFAFSEIQTITGLVAAPVWLIGGSPALAYNFVVILFLTLNGFFAFLLLREWGFDGFPAISAALIVQSLPFVSQEFGVLQLIAVFGILWPLYFATRILNSSDRPWIDRTGLIVGLPITFLTCSYYGLFALLLLPVAAVLLFDWRAGNPRPLMRCATIGALSLLFASPLLLKQKSILDQHGMSRTEVTVERGAARVANYLMWSENNTLYSGILDREPPGGRKLMPGLGLLALFAVALVGRSTDHGRLSRRARWYCIAVIVGGLLLSFGPRISLFGWQPYWLLHDHLPGFSSLRSPYRFAMLVHLHLALLAAWGISAIRFPPLALGLTLFALVETLAIPQPLQAVPDLSTPTRWESWLREQDDPRVMLLPYPPTTDVGDFERTTVWMLRQPLWGGEMVNGYSGYFPHDYPTIREEMNRFPGPEGLRILREKGVDFVVVDYASDGSPSRAAVDAQLAVAFEDPGSRVVIYRLSP